MLAFCVIFVLIPKTKQCSPEELDYIFGVPNCRHASYQLTTIMPWWCKRYLLFQRDARLELLYMFNWTATDKKTR